MADGAFRRTLESEPRTFDTKTLTSRITNSEYGWMVLVFVVVFLLLWYINPPIVQKKKTDMSAPSPNITTIFVLSLICSCALPVTLHFL